MLVEERCGESVPVAPVDLEDSNPDVLTDGELPGRSAVNDALLLSSYDLSEHAVNAGHPAWHEIAGLHCIIRHQFTIFPAPAGLARHPRPVSALGQV